MNENKTSSRLIIPAIMMILTLLMFLFFYSCIIKVDYNNLGGAHSWLTGSTIKFVNNWFYDGIITDHFTFYERFDSIEHHTLESREPYVSYPTGVGVLVYLSGKIIGRNHVTVSAVKRIAMALFAMEAMLISAFVYVFLGSEWFAWEGAPYKRAIAGFAMGMMWMLIPANAWYLINSFFADQAVIFYVILFCLLDYIWLKRHKLIIRVLEILVIYAGVLTDYYFWLVVCAFFIFRVIRSIIEKDTVRIVICNTVHFVIPVLLGLLTFYWQIQYTDGFIRLLKDKLFLRTGGMEEDQEYGNYYMIAQNMRHSLFNGSYQKMFIFLCIQVIFLVLIFIILARKDWKCLFQNDEISFLLCLWISTISQVILLRNHSAIHEFSQIKIGLLAEFTIIVMTMVLNALLSEVKIRYFAGKVISIDKTAVAFCLSFLILMLLIDFPYSTYRFVRSRDKKEEYRIEQVISDLADYNEVYFSFTYPIPINPPMNLSVSEKEVYKIDEISDIDKLFPEQSSEVKRILLIDKTDQKKDALIKEKERAIIKEGKIKYEDDSMILVWL